MTEAEIIKGLEDDARDVRLSEQEVFRNILKGKQRRFRKLLLIAVGGFVLLASAWLFFHCLPLMSGN